MTGLAAPERASDRATRRAAAGEPRAFGLLALSAALATAASAGCIDFLDPDVGPLAAPLCINEDSDPGTDVSFRRDIEPMIFDRAVLPCRDCHAPDAPTPFGFETSGLDLTSFDTLIDGGINSGADIVVPGRPCDSIIVQKVSEGPPFGSRMPFGGPPFLNNAERQLLSDWIAEGAQNN